MISILLFAGLNFFYILFFQQLTRNSIQRRKEKLLQQNQLAQHPARVWIMGDSHPMLGIKPGILENAINLAGTSEYYFLTLQKLKSALAKAKSKPEIILLPMDLHSFSEQGLALLLKHELDDCYWSRIIGIQEICSGDFTSDLWRWWIQARLFPHAGQFYRLFSWLKKEEYKVENDGFVAAKENFSLYSSEERKKLAEQRFLAHYGKYPVIDPFQVQALQDIQKLCREENIQLILISYPVSEEYLQLINDNPMLTKAKMAWSNMAAECGGVWDYREAFLGEKNLFSDPDHLNEAGALKFSKMVTERLKSIRQTPGAAPEASLIRPFLPSVRQQIESAHPEQAVFCRIPF